MREKRSVACAWALLALAFAAPAYAQFKEIGPAPFPPAVARQKMRKLLESVEPGNRKQTVATLSGWVAWYREILDEELITAWRRDARANLPGVIETLADERVAVGVVSFSWREARKATFQLPFAPMLTSLMSRYSKSAEPFIHDVGHASALSPSEAETACRILIDMPEIGTWRELALHVLPEYADIAKRLLEQDLHTGNQENMYRAEMWLADLNMKSPAAAPQLQTQRRSLPTPAPEIEAERPRRIHVDGPPSPTEAESRPARSVLPSAPILQPKPSYDGPRTGTYESTGGSIPQNAEYVFRNVPAVALKLDYDSRIWEARLVPSEGNTQRLLVRNKSGGPQKRCVVHWTVVQ